MSQVTHEAIADAVADIIGGLPAAPTVTVRSQAYRVEGDALSLVIVTMGPERELTRLTGGRAMREYVIVVTVLYAGNQQLVTTIGTAKGWRQTIRQALLPDDTTNEPLPTEPTVYSADAVELSAEDESAHRANYQTSRLLLVYRNSELTRGGT